MKIKTIFFDFDGVITDSVDVKTRAFYNLYLPFGKNVADKVVAHHLANGGVSRFEKFRYYHREFLGREISQNEFDDFLNNFSELVISEVVASPDVTGIRDFLNDYYREINFYIVTGTPTEEIKLITERKKLASYFKGQFGSPEKKYYWVESIIKSENLVPDECVFIGDALADYEAAEKNNIHFILRETADNKKLFSFFNGQRIKDFIAFDKLINEYSSK